MFTPSAHYRSPLKFPAGSRSPRRSVWRGSIARNQLAFLLAGAKDRAAPTGEAEQALRENAKTPG